MFRIIPLLGAVSSLDTLSSDEAYEHRWPPFSANSERRVDFLVGLALLIVILLVRSRRCFDR